MFVTKFVELVRGERVLINEVKFGITTTGDKDGPYNKHWFRGVAVIGWCDTTDGAKYVGKL